MRHSLLAIVALACATPPLTTPLAAQASGVRRWAADSFWTRAWYRGGTRESELLVEPRQVVSSGDLVMVLDLGLREVTAFDARTGATRFVLKATGQGPGEFQRPGLIAPTREGFLVVDHATSRLTAFDRTGRATWNAPLPGAVSAEGLCAGADGQLLAKLAGSVNALTTVDTGGRILQVRSLHWADPGARTMTTAGVIAGPDARGHCVFAARYGGEWMLVPARGAVVRRPYIVRHPAAVVAVTEGRQQRTGVRSVVQERLQFTSSAPGTSGAMLRGDTVIMRGATAEAFGYRLLDYYLLPSGRYVHSRRLPLDFVATAVSADGVFFGAMIGEESGALVALRPGRTRSAARGP